MCICEDAIALQHHMFTLHSWITSLGLATRPLMGNPSAHVDAHAANKGLVSLRGSCCRDQADVVVADLIFDRTPAYGLDFLSQSIDSKRHKQSLPLANAEGSAN